ncbi:MAG: hypothetical protein ACFCU1_11255 [Sumerlaeia bacterium]
MKIPLLNIKSAPDLAPAHDEQFAKLFASAINGTVPVYFAAVPVGNIVPFDLDYRPDLNKMGAAGIQHCFKQAQQGHFQKLIVYQRGAWFVVSDDYVPLFAYLQGGPDYMPCWIMGKPTGNGLKDVQGPLATTEVKKAFGIG